MSHARTGAPGARRVSAAFPITRPAKPKWRRKRDVRARLKTTVE